MGSTTSISRRKFIELLGATGAIGAVSIAGVTGCSGSSSSSSSSSTGTAKFKIGGIGPVTGAAAIYGTACKNGAQIAVDEINAAAGTVQFDYDFQDDEHDPEKSVNAYNNLKDWGMQLLVGTTTTAPCVAVSAETNSDNMFELTPSASSTDVIGGQPDDKGNISIARKKNVFQICFTDPNQGTASAKYIKEQSLGTKIAVIYNNSDAYSTGIYKKFSSEAQSLGLTIVSTTTFTDDTATDFSVQLNDAKNNGADLVFLPIYYTPASLILKQASTMGYAPKFFGDDGLDGILTLEGFDASLAEGVMLLTPFTADATDEKTQSFVSSYKKAYNDTPNQFAADAYDCVYAIKQAIEKCGVTADMTISDMCDKMVETFTSSDFKVDGLTGDSMTWSDTGEVSKEPKGMVIKNGAYAAM
jgi:branched-chain amino acid transport system substrate-binding protein